MQLIRIEQVCKYKIKNKKMVLYITQDGNSRGVINLIRIDH